MLCVFSHNIRAQTVVNKVWQTFFGEPLASFEWSASVFDGNGNTYTVGHNTLTNGKVGAYTTKHDSLGNLLWEKTFSVTSIDASYGVAITIDNSGNVYIAGAAYYAASLQFDFLVVKYENDGDQVWYATRNGTGNGNDYASALIVDSGQNVYITGTSKGVGTNMDFMTLKLHANGTFHWVKRYDYAQLDEAPASIRFLNVSTIEVSGGSASSGNSWDIASVRYKLPNGLSGPSYRREAFDMDFDRPMSLVRNVGGDLFVCGSAASDSTGYDMVFARLDSALAVVWQTGWDGGQGWDDSALDIQLNSSGEVVVTGSADLDSLGDKSALIVLQLDGDNGALLWERRHLATELGQKAKGVKIRCNADDHVIVSGSALQGNNQRAITLKYDNTGSLLWERIYEGEAGTESTRPTALQIADDGSIWVGGVNKESGKRTYFWIKYEDYNRNETFILGQDSLPLYTQADIIVRFSPDVVDTAFVNNPDRNWSTVSDIITDENLIGLMDSILGAGGTLGDWKLFKIFHHIKSTSLHIERRQGGSVNIPDIWSALLLEIGEAQTKHPVSVCLALDSLPYPYIRYAHPNYALITASPPPPDDEYYDIQHSLWDTPEFTNADINIEPAWDILDNDQDNGWHELSVALFDTGVRFRHEDFICDNCPGLENSIVTRALRFYGGNGAIDISGEPNDELDQFPSSPANLGHGTRSAGVIAALRNNQKGIAGVAGGNLGDSQFGVLLNSYQVTTKTDYSSLINLIDAIAYEVEDSETGAGIFCIEMQIKIPPENEASFLPQVKILRELIEMAYDAGIVQLTARGNFGNIDNNESVIYPAMYKDNWMISVGASGVDGEHINASLPDGGNGSGSSIENYRTSYGENMDFIAPGSWGMIYSTIKTGVSDYEHFNGTSAALPHATGLAALLLMHSRDELAQEDLEKLMEYSSIDIINMVIDPPYPTGYDEYNGWGRLNAGQALEMISPQHDNLRVVHFEFEGEYEYEDLTCNNEIECPFWLLNGFWDLCANDEVQGASAGILRKVYAPFDIPLESQYGISPADLGSTDKPAWWVRSAAANLWDKPVFNTAGNYYEVAPGNQVFFDEGPVYENGHLTGVIAGYQLILSEELNNTFPPCPLPLGTPDPLVLPEYYLGPPHLGFSLLATAPENFTGPIVLTDQEEPLDSPLQLTAYPNPAGDRVTLSYQLKRTSPVTLTLYDTQGRQCQNIINNHEVAGLHSTVIDLTKIPPGLYFCSLQTPDSIQTIKLIKL